MEARNYIRPILAGLVGIGLVILVIVFIVKLVGGGSSTAAQQIDVTKYASTPDASVTMLADGPTRYDGEHYQLKITVTPISNEIDVIQGYEGTVVQTQSYPNNAEAFSVFLQTLQHEGFSKGKADHIDYRGYCPTGERFSFSLSAGTKDNFTYTSTSCGQGNFQGQRDVILELFRRQIPVKDYDTYTNNIGFSL